MIDLFKRKPIRNADYTRWVKQQPSVISGRPADDPHHIQGHGFSGTGKASDIFVIPLTRDEHTELHNIGWREWERRYGLQMVYCLRTIERAMQEGIL